MKQVLIDLHTHTYPRSEDSLLSPRELLTEAKRKGLDGICITEHDRFWDEEEVAALGREHGLLVFPGCEVTTEEGHLLVFGLDRYVFGMHRASFVRDLVDKAGGVMLVAHPYRRRFREEEATEADAYQNMVDRACQSDLFALADGIEVFNGRGAAAENAFSLEVCHRFNLRGTAASDAHRVEDVGSFATHFFRPVSTLAELIEELKAGNFRTVAFSRGLPGGECARRQGR
ncbi:MAG: PHP domain-containing protein [Chloroflexi bacterium]|nr:PHP domain-containing protein [Chloroflexota bacterium]